VAPVNEFEVVIGAYSYPFFWALQPEPTLGIPSWAQKVCQHRETSKEERMAEHSTGKATRDTGRDVRLVIMTLAVVLLVWFIAANTAKVQIHFWLVTAKVSLISVILISAALGAVISLLLSHSRKKK